MATLIQFRRDTAANWAAANPLLSQGELGLVTDTGNYKIGNGTDNWNALSYYQLSAEVNSLLMTAIADPGAAPSGKMYVYPKVISGRVMLKMVGPAGLDTALQPFLGRNKVGYWCPPGNAVTVPGVFGFAAYTAVGSPTARNIAVTNLFTRMRRLGFVGSGTAGNAASVRVPAGQVTLGNGAGMGGFHKIIRWGISDAVFVTAARTFMGVSSTTSAIANVEPSTLLNCIGMGAGAADTNFKIFYGGSTAQTPINLGSNFPSNTTNTDVYELALFSPSGQDGVVYYEVTRINTGDVASGMISGSPGVVLPANTTLLSYTQSYRNNNATALAAAIDIMSDYIETDN